MKLAVFGATGRTSRPVCERALEQAATFEGVTTGRPVFLGAIHVVAAAGVVAVLVDWEVV